MGAHKVVHDCLEEAIRILKRETIRLHEQDLQNLIEVDEHPDVSYPLIVELAEVAEVHACDPNH